MVPYSPSRALRPTTPRMAVLETVRFGEFLRDQMLLSEEQWLAALARHWSIEPRQRFGETVVSLGFLSEEIIERAASEFHDGLDVIEVGSPRRPRPTA